ncbi:MAG: hypothetical protein F6K04_19960 [Leptolyngbya sp. SIO4C5]|nr:hypothetical protein [Leptolyngbya sp. SIO4C5]
MAWQSYGLDRVAQKLVLRAQEIDNDSEIRGSDCLREAYKMRTSVAYGLERFWGEHLRHKGKEDKKAAYWKETWNALVEIMADAKVTLPNNENPKTMSEQLWGERSINSSGTKLNSEDQKAALAVLTQLCDCIVWWTQRYK